MNPTSLYLGSLSFCRSRVDISRHCFGHPYSRTPNVDSLARDGTRLMQFPEVLLQGKRSGPIDGP